MNIIQRLVLLAGAAIFIYLALYPPDYYMVSNGIFILEIDRPKQTILLITDVVATLAVYFACKSFDSRKHVDEAGKS